MKNTKGKNKQESLNDSKSSSLDNQRDRYQHWLLLRKQFRSNALSAEEICNDYLPAVKILFEIGAHHQFQQELEDLKAYSSEYIYMTYKVFECYSHDDYTGMLHHLKNIEQANFHLSDKEQLRFHINKFCAYYNLQMLEAGEREIMLMEEMAYSQNLYMRESLENMMIYYEGHKQTEKAERLILFISSLQAKTWHEAIDFFNIVYFHYRRTNQLRKNQLLIDEFQQKVANYQLTQEERLFHEIDFLHLLFENQMAWENYSIKIYQNRHRYLDFNLNIAEKFASVFLHINHFSFEVYNRVLADHIVKKVAEDVVQSLLGYMSEADSYLQKESDDFLYHKRSLLKVKIDLAELRYITEEYNLLDLMTEKCRLMKYTINLCRINDDERELLHQLDVYADELLAMVYPDYSVEELRLQDKEFYTNELHKLVEDINKILTRNDFNASSAYYLLITANIFDRLNNKEKAAYYLRKFVETHVDFRNFTLPIQAIYYRLQVKYQTGTLPPDLKLHTQIEHIETLHRQHQTKECAILCNDIWDTLQLSNRQKPESIQTETLLNFLCLYEKVMLNAFEYQNVCKAADLFRHISADLQLPISIEASHLLFHSEALVRLGCIADASTIVNSVLRRPHLPQPIRLDVLILRGKIECKENFPKFKINSLSEALGLAEQLNQPDKIISIYRHMAEMFIPAYPALAISMLRKAETYFIRNGIPATERQDVGLERAQACFFLHKFWADRYPNTCSMQTEAIRILNAIHRNQLKDDAARALFDRIYGLIHNDIKPLWGALRFYLAVNAAHDIWQTCEAIIIIGSWKGLNDDIVKASKIYNTQAKKAHDVTRLSHISSLMQAYRLGTRLDFRPPRQEVPPTLLFIIDQIAYEEECWAVSDGLLRRLFPGPVHEGMCIAMVMPDGHVSLNPVCQIPFQYYRGQSEAHIPCRPSLYRSHMNKQKQFLERLKYEEFRLLIESHPITTKYMSGYKAHFPDGDKPLPFNVYYEALAQHYGIATPLMDVTSDKWVAAFFACTTCKDDVYTIYDGPSEYGIFYICNEKTEDMNKGMPMIRPVGIQPFARPGEQQGYVYPMGREEDFETRCRKLIFQHDHDVAELIFNFANRSQKLFPPDPIVEKAQRICHEQRSFSEKALQLVKVDFYPLASEDDIHQLISELGLSFQEEPIVAFSQQDIDDFNRTYPDFEQKLKRNVIIQPTFREQQKDANGNDITLIHMTPL